MLNIISKYRITKFRPSCQISVDNVVNPTLDEMSKAGLLATLDDSCRTVVCDEADVTLNDTGLFLTHNMGKTVTEMNCRGSLTVNTRMGYCSIRIVSVLIMTLFDRQNHAYVRQLANRCVSVKRSKLNILV